MAKRLIIFSLTAATATAAFAQAGPGQTASRADLVKELDEGFARVDTNKDGVVTKDEVDALKARLIEQANENLHKKMAEDFARLDKDKNGQLSLAEFQGGAAVKPKANASSPLDRMDTNKDGKINKAEFSSRPLAAFDRLDANKDGKITPEEQRKGVGR